MIRRLWRSVLALGVLIALVGVSATTSFADDPKPGSPKVGQGRNGGIPSDYVFTPAELKAIAEKDALAAQHTQQKKSNQRLSTISTGGSGRWLSIGEYHEPNDAQHVNYCGPGATQVALSARLASWQIDNIDAIGAAENIDPNRGVFATAIRDYLNPHLNTGWYLVSGASNQQNFEYRIGLDIDNGYVLVTGLVTRNMPGWSISADHIVAVYGYWYDGLFSVSYVETAAPRAGYNGPYRNDMTSANFWGFVSQNNVQVW